MNILSDSHFNIDDNDDIERLAHSSGFYSAEQLIHSFVNKVQMTVKQWADMN